MDRVVWTEAARKKVHPRRPGPEVVLDRHALWAHLRATWKDHAQWRRINEPPGNATLAQVKQQLESVRDPGVGDLGFEVLRAALLSAQQASPFDKAAGDLVGYWVAVGGASFALDVLVESFLWTDVRPRDPEHRGEPDALGLWTALRSYLAGCPEPDFRSVRRRAAQLRPELDSRVGVHAALLARAALAYLFPSERDWAMESAREVVARVRAGGRLGEWKRHPWCVIASVDDLDEATAVLEAAGPWQLREFSWTLLDLHGPDALRLLDRIALGAPREAAEAISLIDGPSAAEWFAARVAHPRVAKRAIQYLMKRPEAATQALVPLLAQSDETAKAAGDLLLEIRSRFPEVVDRLAAREGARDALAKLLGHAPAEGVPVDLPACLGPDAPPPRRALGRCWNPARLPPPLLRRSDTALPLSAVERLGGLLAASVGPPSEDVLIVRQACTADSLAVFALALAQAWVEAGGLAKEKWALFALGHLGGQAGVERLAQLLLDWPEVATARSDVALQALAAVPSDTALQQLRELRRRLWSPRLKEQVEAALEAAAKQRGVSVDDLEDRLLPTLGLGPEGSRSLDYGARAFRVGLDARSEPFLSSETGQRLRRLPPPAAGDDPERAALAQSEWSRFREEALKLLKGEAHRLEACLCRGRLWTVADFRALIAHPLLRTLCRRLLWEARSGSETALFRIAEDDSLADVADRAYSLPAEGGVALPHPLVIPEPILARWAGVFADYQIVQPFEQLARAVFRPTPNELGSKSLVRVAGRPTSRNRLFALRHRGWRSVFGSYEENDQLQRPLPGTPYSAFLRIGAGPTLGKVTLEDEDLRKHAFGKLGAVPFSELVRDLEAGLA